MRAGRMLKRTPMLALLVFIFTGFASAQSVSVNVSKDDQEVSRVKSAIYKIDGRFYKLRNGRWESGDETIQIANYAIGKTAIAIVLVQNARGSGLSYHFFLLDKQFRQQGYLGLEENIDIQNLQIDEERQSVILRGDFHGDNDSRCCPTQGRTLTFKIPGFAQSPKP